MSRHKILFSNLLSMNVSYIIRQTLNAGKIISRISEQNVGRNMVKGKERGPK